MRTSNRNSDSTFYCDIHAEDYTDFCQSCSDDRKAQYPIRLFVLSSGYVAVFSHISDILYWGSCVIPLAFGSEVSSHEAVERIRANNPDHLVTFSGGLREYKTLFE